MSRDTPRDEVEKMIGTRVENMKGLFIVGFVLSWAALAVGIWVGVTYYPWAYAMGSGIFALVVLTIIQSLAFLFMWKTAMEKPVNP
ncbi:MAG: hypothetical protein V3T40_04635 [Nitrososphaerales archaeon]